MVRWNMKDSHDSDINQVSLLTLLTLAAAPVSPGLGLPVKLINQNKTR